MKTTLSITLAVLALLLFAMVPAIAQEGPDENEPNDEQRNADPIDGFTIEGEIGRRGDTDDWFVLDGQEGYNPTITLYYDDSECDIDLDVLSDDEVVSGLYDTTSPDSDDFDIPDTCYLHVYVYDGDGEYTIEIEPESGGRDGRNDRRRGDDCEGPDEVESNDDYDLADFIDGYEIEGYACEGEDDWFVLDGQEGYYPEFYLEYNDRDCDIDMEIYSGSGRDRDLVGSLSSTDSPDIGSFDVEDTCYLRVFAFDGEGDYYIEITPDSGEDCEGPDEVEPNNSENLADSIDSLYFEGYACEDDVDWFYLEGQEGRHPTITIYYDDDECDIDMDIYSDDDFVGSLIASTSPDGDDFRIPGECWLMVYCYDGEGWYEIEIEP